MIIALIAIAISVSLDAFAVSIGKGMTAIHIKTGDALATALWFGGFQALFPLIGIGIGTELSAYLGAVNHWIIFVLLTVLGGNMIREAFRKDTIETRNSQFDWRHMLPLAIACSIDALAVGVSLAFMKVSVWLAVSLIGAVTAVLSVTGLHLGKIVGIRWQKPAQVAGGVVLILIGVKVLLEHFGMLP